MPKLVHPLVLGLAVVVGLLTLPALTARAQAPAWQWAHSPGGGTGLSTTADAAGNIYVTGRFSDTATFGNTTLISAGMEDIFIAKLTSGGVYQWAVRAGGPEQDSGTDVVVDASGQVTVTGYFYSLTADFGPTVFSNHGGPYNTDVFVAKLSASGNWEWAQQAGGPGYDSSAALTLDAAGNSYVSGMFSLTGTFGDTTLTAAGNTDAFVARLSAAGSWQWVASAFGNGQDQCTGVAVTAGGEVVVSGNYWSSSLTLGSIVLPDATPSAPASNTANAFVARLSPMGTWQWATQPRHGGGHSIFGLVMDRQENVYVTGSFGFTAGDTLSFGATTLRGNGRLDAFVAKLNAVGSWEWAVGVGGADYELAGNLALDSTDNLLVSGVAVSPGVAFGATTLTNAGPDWEAFLACLSPAGSWQWALNTAGAGDEQGGGITIDGTGHIVLVGGFSGVDARFGALTVPRTAGWRFSSSSFIVRLQSVVTALPAAINSADYSLFPNPAHTAAHLSGAAPHAPLTLLDALGHPVLTATADAWGAATLPVRGLPAGLYLLRGAGVARRLVVE